MRIVKIKPDNKTGNIKGVDKYRVLYPNDEPGKEKVQRRFAIKRLKYIGEK